MANVDHGFRARINDLFGNLFAGSHRHGGGEMDRHYVSDYTRFIDTFLERHPEEIEEQHKGWYIWWDKRIDLDEQAREEAASVPDDGYGFYSSAWRRDEPPH